MSAHPMVATNLGDLGVRFDCRICGRSMTIGGPTGLVIHDRGDQEASHSGSIGRISFGAEIEVDQQPRQVH